ncbi:MAG: 7-cyano-7-deazaguanine synthase [Fimbriimonadaceae bacterium]|nr:7-cyano-7-deazaguanine synthase [Fimbriimonadaceae bacterium]QYK59135.1 MAG: 7-cyano-7-deazaguanine synthase [Fimbriimonadaceae bacterium]
MFGGIAAYLVDARQAVVPESGQGIFGPVLTATLQGYPDYRNHPMFSAKVAKIIESVFGHRVEYVFPRMWSTKGETLRALMALGSASTWEGTRSCWQDSRWCSVNGKRLQCGVCAACLLRRQSFHSAGLKEPVETYAFENLHAMGFPEAAPPGFRVTNALRHYAIGAVQQLDHFNREWLGEASISRHAASVALVTSIPFDEARAQLFDLIDRHAKEWAEFVGSLGETSFIRHWVGGTS